MAPKPKPRKALKRPTGELSKSNSKLAKFIKGSASGKDFTKAEARTAAGKYRDIEKAAGPKGFSGMGALDRSGVALGKAEAATKAMRKPAAKKTKPKSTLSKVGKALSKTPAGKVVKRAKIVAREARDIPTAVGTAISGRNVQYGGGAFARKDLKTQIKEVGSAIKSGKKGTEAAQVRFASKKKGTVGSSGLDQNVSKKKAKRK
jgi:hypothetical protein